MSKFPRAIRLCSAIFFTFTVALYGCESTDLNDGTVPSRNPVDIAELVDIRNLRVASAAGDNLLANPDFEEEFGDFPGWSTCVDDAVLTTAAGRRDGRAVKVGEQDCILQAVEVNPGSSYSLSCNLVVADENSWSGLGLSFYDSNRQFISESVVPRITSRNWIQWTTIGAAPADAVFGLAWFYTEAGGSVDACNLSLKSDGSLDNTQNYRKTLVVQKSSTRVTGNGFGADNYGVSFNGFSSRQVYPARSYDKTLIDGFESGGPGRSFNLAAAVTDDYLHVLVNIAKARNSFSSVTPASVFDDSYPQTGQLWNDDSIEIYLNVGNEPNAGYDSNDFLRIYGYKDEIDYVPVSVTGDNSRLNLTDEAKCAWEEYFGISCEVRFSLEELGIAGLSDAEIGFDLQVNFDDDGNDRDAKYSWCGGDTVTAWRDMSVVDCSLRIIQ